MDPPFTAQARRHQRWHIPEKWARSQGTTRIRLLTLCRWLHVAKRPWRSDLPSADSPAEIQEDWRDRGRRELGPVAPRVCAATLALHLRQKTSLCLSTTARSWRMQQRKTGRPPMAMRCTRPAAAAACSGGVLSRQFSSSWSCTVAEATQFLSALALRTWQGLRR